MVKVVVAGAAGGIGQPLSLLLKSNPQITHLALYDIVNTPGVAADLSHINSNAKVTGHVGNDQLEAAITGADVVVIPAGVPRKPGMSRDDLFAINAGIVRDLATAAAKCAPNAFMCIISNPVNSTVPIVAEVFKKHGVYDPKRIFGVTTLDLVRASTFTSELVATLKPNTAVIPVVGGHSGVTILPLLSQVAGTDALSEEQIKTLTNRIQFGGDEVVKAKAGAGSATLSMAYAGARFTNSILEAIAGKSVSEYSFVNLEADSENCGKIKDTVCGLDYFSVRVELGPKGVQKLHPIGDLSAYEKTLLEAAIPELKANIENGVNFIKPAKL